MAAKTWESDFRAQAVQASLRELGEIDLRDPFEYSGSFCLPVGEKPIVGWTPGRVTLIALVLGFCLLGAGALLAAATDDQPRDDHDKIMLIVAGCCSVMGIITFFLPLKLDRWIVCWLMGERGRALIERSLGAEMMTAELSNADKSNVKLSIDGDDHVLILFDEENRRMLLEGIGARYQIRAADVEKLAEFEILNYYGVEIIYRINSEVSCRVAIARVSLLIALVQQVPILFFLRRFATNKIFKKCSQTLGEIDSIDSDIFLDD